MTAEKLSYEDFLESLRLAPRLTVELVIENNDGGILLIQRDKDPFKDFWHLPGGFLLKGEVITDCVRRIAAEELDSQIDYSKGKFLGLFENIDGDPRGHILHYVVEFNFGDNPSATGEFFTILPEKTIPYQRNFLRKLGYQ